MSARGPLSLPPGLARELEAFLRVVVREEIRAARAGDDPDPWVDHRRWPCVSRRAALVLARSGELEGVRRVGKGSGTLYLARRSAVDAWIEGQNVTATEAPAEDPYERAMAKRNLVAGAAPATDAPRARRKARR